MFPLMFLQANASPRLAIALLNSNNSLYLSILYLISLKLLLGWAFT